MRINVLSNVSKKIVFNDEDDALTPPEAARCLGRKHAKRIPKHILLGCVHAHYCLYTPHQRAYTVRVHSVRCPNLALLGQP